MEDAHDAGLPFRMIAMCHRCAESFAAWADAHYGLRPDGTPVIINMEAEAAACLRRGNECFAICDNRDYQDYIYSLSDLCQLTGRKYQPKRNHVNRFEALYDYTFEELRVEDIDECLRLEGEWQQRKEADEVDDVEHRTEHEYEMSEEQRATAAPSTPTRLWASTAACCASRDAWLPLRTGRRSHPRSSARISRRPTRHTRASSP